MKPLFCLVAVGLVAGCDGLSFEPETARGPMFFSGSVDVQYDDHRYSGVYLYSEIDGRVVDGSGVLVSLKDECISDGVSFEDGQTEVSGDGITQRFPGRPVLMCGPDGIVSLGGTIPLEAFPSRSRLEQIVVERLEASATGEE